MLSAFSLSSVLQHSRAVVADLEHWAVTHTRPHEPTTLHLHTAKAAEAEAEAEADTAPAPAPEAQSELALALVDNDADHEFKELIESDAWAADHIDVALHSEALAARILKEAVRTSRHPWNVLHAFDRAAKYDRATPCDRTTKCAHFNTAHALIKACILCSSQSNSATQERFWHNMARAAIALAIRGATCASVQHLSQCVPLATDAIKLWYHHWGTGGAAPLKITDLLLQNGAFAARTHAHIYVLIESLAAMDVIVPHHLVDLLSEECVRHDVLKTLMACGPRTLQLLAYVWDCIITMEQYSAYAQPRYAEVKEFMWMYASPSLKRLCAIKNAQHQAVEEVCAAAKKRRR